jgi:perosamine synthetase
MLERKRAIAAAYRKQLIDLPVSFQVANPDVVTSDWLVSLLLPRGTDRDLLMKHMAKVGVDTRPVFYCAHTMPMYHDGSNVQFPVAQDIARRGLSLPSYPTLATGDLHRVCQALRNALNAQELQHQDAESISPPLCKAAA